MTIMELAKEDSQITGKRFVAIGEGSGLWNRPCCVIDAQMGIVVAGGMKYQDARKLASELEKAHDLRPNDPSSATRHTKRHDCN